MPASAERAEASKLAKDKAGVDSMDSYMEEMKEKERLAGDRQRLKRMSEIQDEMAKTQRMIKIATPALALDAVLPVKKPGAPQLSAFTFKQFAGASKKGSSSAVTAEATAAARALAEKVFASPAAPDGGDEAASSAADANASEANGDGGLHALRPHLHSPAARKPATAEGPGAEGPGQGVEEARTETEATAQVAESVSRDKGMRDAKDERGPADKDKAVGQKRVREGSAGREGQGSALDDTQSTRAAGVPHFADFEQGGL